MISAHITGSSGEETRVYGKTIDEVIEKIREFHTLDSVNKEIYARNNELEAQLKSGWWVKDSQG